MNFCFCLQSSYLSFCYLEEHDVKTGFPLCKIEPVVVAAAANTFDRTYICMQDSYIRM